LVRDTSPGIFPTADNFDKLYRAQPSFDGGPKPFGIPWDIHQTRRPLAELAATAGAAVSLSATIGGDAVFLCGDHAHRRAAPAGRVVGCHPRRRHSNRRTIECAGPHNGRFQPKLHSMEDRWPAAALLSNLGRHDRI
jgi:hypothetical protein